MMKDNIEKIDNVYLKKVHKYTLELLFFIDKLCRKYNINYTLDCGTLIGAVRHKGFIPWDDDADVAFLRKDYEKFIKVLEIEKLPENIKVHRPTDTEDFFDFNIRLYNTKEKVRFGESDKNSYGGFYQYAIVDIFVYDNIPDNEIKAFTYVSTLQYYFGLAMSRRREIYYKKYSTLAKSVIFVLSHFGKNKKLNKLIERYNLSAKKYMKKKAKRLYCTSWKPEYPGYRYNVSDFKEYTDVDFESGKLMIIKNYDNVLKKGYGDYMTPVRTHDHADVENIIKK